MYYIISNCKQIIAQNIINDKKQTSNEIPEYKNTRTINSTKLKYSHSHIVKLNHNNEKENKKIY